MANVYAISKIHRKIILNKYILIRYIVVTPKIINGLKTQKISKF